MLFIPFDDVETMTIQSKKRKRRKEYDEKLVFYPSENSQELAFSVNLRNIAKHYVHDLNVREILNAKADEHLDQQQLTKRRNLYVYKDHLKTKDEKGSSIINTSTLQFFLSSQNLSQKSAKRVKSLYKQVSDVPKP